MPNVMRIGDDEYTLADGVWTATSPGADDVAVRIADSLTRITATLPPPGPADGFATRDRTMATRTAGEIGASLVGLDPVEVPASPPPGTVY